MYVQMRYALAHLVVDGDKRALRAKGFLYGSRDQLRCAEQRRQQIRRDVRQRIEVLFGTDQAMTGIQRSVIKKNNRVCVFVYSRRIHLAGNNPAKHAPRSAHWLTNFINRQNQAVRPSLLSDTFASPKVAISR